MKKQNLRSEAAIKRWLKLPYSEQWIGNPSSDHPHIIFLNRAFWDNDDNTQRVVIAEIDLRDLIKKRKPLTGIKKQMSEIVSGKKKVRKWAQ